MTAPTPRKMPKPDKLWGLVRKNGNNQWTFCHFVAFTRAQVQERINYLHGPDTQNFKPVKVTLAVRK